MAVNYECVGCRKKKKFKSRDAAASEGWRGCRIGNGTQFCQCGCMSRKDWNNYIDSTEWNSVGDKVIKQAHDTKDGEHESD